MKRTCLVFCIVLTVVCFAFLSFGCKKKSKSDDSPPAQTGTVAITVADQIVDQVVADLRDAGMTDSQIEPVQIGALAVASPSLWIAKLPKFMTKTFSRFFLAGDPNDVTFAAPSVCLGAVGALNDPATGLEDAARKAEIAGIIAGAVVKALSDKMGDISDEQRKALPGDIVNSAIKELDEAGLAEGEMAAAVGAVMSKSVSFLDDGGFVMTDMEAILKTLAEQSMNGLAETGLTYGYFGDVINQMMFNSIGAFDEAGFAAADIQTFMSPFMEGAVLGMATIDIKSTTQAQMILQGMMSNAVLGLQDAAITDAGQYEGIMGNMFYGAAIALPDYGMGAEDMYNVFDDMMVGMVSVLGDVGFADQQNVTAITKGINGKALATLQEFEFFTDVDMLKEASTAIASGSMMGLGGMFEGETDMMAAMMQDISATSMKQLYDVAAYMDLGSEFGNIAASYAAGMVEGLAYADWSSTAIAGFEDEIAAGFTDGMTGTITDMSQYTNMINGSIAGTINEFPTTCQKEGGTWNESEELCDWPSAVPPANATMPTQAEWENCVYNIGGTVDYLADGTWNCNTNAGALDDPAAIESCNNTDGYHWENGKCMPNPTSGALCYAGTDAATCPNAGCVWDGLYCVASAQISCSSAYLPADCSMMGGGCMWKVTEPTTGTGYCTNYENLGCGQYTTELPCDETPGCAWNATVAPASCVPATEIQCSTITASISCNAPCTWIDTGTSQYCSNTTTIDCSSRGTDTCTNECVWIPTTGCINAENAACPAFPVANCPARCTLSGGICSEPVGATCVGKVEGECTGDCIWTGDANGCAPKSAITSPSLCPAFEIDHCDAASSYLSGMALGSCTIYNGTCAPSCDSITMANGGCMACSGRSDCAWDMSMCKTAVEYCNGLDSISCQNSPGTRYCSWGGTCTPKTRATCWDYNYTNESTCTASNPECFWSDPNCISNCQL